MTTEKPYGWNAASGMTLLAKLKSDLKAAMLSKNEAVKGALRIIISEFPTKITMPITLESGKKSTRAKRDDEITDDDIISLIMGLCKSERQTLEYKKETNLRVSGNSGGIPAQDGHGRGDRRLGQGKHRPLPVQERHAGHGPDHEAFRQERGRQCGEKGVGGYGGLSVGLIRPLPPTAP